MVFDVDEAGFQQQVIERSSERPVVVDFWAEWCGPCRVLTPALESAAKAREGKVDLAKVDVDANPALAQGFRVQGIPAVKAFRDGRVASEFTGAIPPPEVERFFDALLPSEADELAAEGDEQALRKALEADPAHAGAATSLARILLDRGEGEEAATLLEPFPHDFLAAGLGARARLSVDGDELGSAFAAWDAGDQAGALEQLQDALESEQDADRRDLIRRAMVGMFTELGPDHELARLHRRRLAAALN